MATQMRSQTAIVQHDGCVQVPTEMLDRAGIKPGDEVFFWTNGPGRLHVRALPNLSVEELVERFGDPDVTELDWPKRREEAEEAAAQEFLAAMSRNG